MIRFMCPSCGKVLKAPENRVGARATCPRCGQGMQVPKVKPQKAAVRSSAVRATAPPPEAPAADVILTDALPYRRRSSFGKYVLILGFVAFLAAAGGIALAIKNGYSFTILLGDSGDKPDPRLSPEQQKRWLSIREAQPIGYLIVGYLEDKNEWQVVVWNQQTDSYSWQMKFDFWFDEEETNFTAKEVAEKDGNVRATAVIDLFTKKAPRVVHYFRLEDGGIFQTPKPPTKKLGESMNKFLFRVQTEPF